MIKSFPISASVPPRPITVLALALTGSEVYLIGANPSFVIRVTVPASPLALFFLRIFVPSGIIIKVD